MTHRGVVLLAVLLGLGAGRRAAAQHPDSTTPSYERQVPSKLLAQVKISEDSSHTLALARMPRGSVESVELIRAHGKLQWVWDIKTEGKRGITEVSVDALDGSVATNDEP